MNFAYSGGFVPGMGYNYKKQESSWDGGDPGLNYRFISVPEDNENNYMEKKSSKNLLSDDLFLCEKECNKKTNGKGFKFRDCLRKCKSNKIEENGFLQDLFKKQDPKIKQKELEIQQQLIQAITNEANSSSKIVEENNSKTYILITIAAVVTIFIGISIFFLTRKKEG